MFQLQYLCSYLFHTSPRWSFFFLHSLYFIRVFIHRPPSLPSFAPSVAFPTLFSLLRPLYSLTLLILSISLFTVFPILPYPLHSHPGPSLFLAFILCIVHFFIPLPHTSLSLSRPLHPPTLTLLLLSPTSTLTLLLHPPPANTYLLLRPSCAKTHPRPPPSAYDFTFARAVEGRRLVPYGEAGDCYSKAKCPQGGFSINLAGTELAVSSRTTWLSKGSHAAHWINRLDVSWGWVGWGVDGLWGSGYGWVWVF